VKNEALIYSGVKVAIMGLGVSGRAAVRYAQHCGAKVYVSDNRSEQLFLADEAEFLATVDIHWEAGGHTREFLGQVDLLLLSPGVNLELPLLKDL
jgi:UDP-N-acetylmuramoylalanine--D-glutamate ligase